MNKCFERLYNGIIKENPTFVLTLGMCPTLAVTTSAINGLGMGLTTAAVLALSNLFISLLRKIIPDKVRIPAFIVIVASFVTMVQLLLEAYLPSLNASLGIYIPLIVVNCIILGRAESFAYHNPAIVSFFDGVGMGLGFTIALTLLGMFREFIGSGSFFGIQVFPEDYGITIFVLAPGAFFVLAFLVAIQNAIKAKMAAKGKDVSKIGSGCDAGCARCPERSGCGKPENIYNTSVKKEKKKKGKPVTEEEPEEEEQVYDDDADEVIEDDYVEEEIIEEDVVEEEIIEEEIVEEEYIDEDPVDEGTSEEPAKPEAKQLQQPRKKPSGKKKGKKGRR